MHDAETLHNLEIKLLVSLKDIGEGISTEIISERTGMSRDEISRATEWLKEKKLISSIEDLRQIFSLSELGKKYLSKGLPEKILLKTVEKNLLSIQEAQKKTGLEKNEFNVAMGYLRNEGYISIEKGNIKITKSGILKLNTPWTGEELIKSLSEPVSVESIPEKLRQAIPILKQRNIISVSEEKIIKLHFTAQGKDILPKIKHQDLIDVLTPEIISSKKWKKKKFRKYDISAPSQKLNIGKKQPYLRFVDELKEKLAFLGFEEVSGPYVETEFFNSDVLFMPQDHPAREIHDMFSLKSPKRGNLDKHRNIMQSVKKVHETGGNTGSKGWNYKFNPQKSAQLMLRSQTTAVSARTLAAKNVKIPGKYFTIDRNFRVDVIDWKHLVEFDQVEGIVIDPKANFRELLGMLKMFAVEVGGTNKIKFAPGYFPFTEPSVELHAYIEGKGWTEIGGAGILRPEVTKPLGINVPVIAWGLGILRLFMTKYNVKDMRQVFSDDLKWLREFRW